jgi:hypothetical protein
MPDQTDAQIAAAALSTPNVEQALSYPQTDENREALRAELDNR